MKCRFIEIQYMLVVKRSIAIIVLAISLLIPVSGQNRCNYYSAGLSLRFGTMENEFVGSLRYFDYAINAAYIRRSSIPFSLINSLSPLDIGWGLRGIINQEFFKTSELDREISSLEITPVARLFFLQNGFFELGYSFSYFIDGHTIIKDSASNIQYALPQDKGYEFGISLGAGYMFHIRESIAIEPRLVFTLNNNFKSETGSAISDDLLRHIRFVVNINLVRVK